jgi:hypothetical protein
MYSFEDQDMTPTRTHAGEQSAPRMYTRGDAMRILRIGETSLHWLTRTGKLQTVRIGGRVLIPAVELDRLCRKGATLSEAEKRAARNNTEPHRRVRPRQPQEAPL